MDDIEFYYHEKQDGGLNAPVMYHTNDHEKRSDLPYFQVGSMNCHVSGVDMTFENQAKGHRASLLIRGHRVESLTDGVWTGTKKQKNSSTYFYGDLMMGIPLSSSLTIEWVNIKAESDCCEVENCTRMNVPAYKKDENNSFVKDSNGNYVKEEISVEQYDAMPAESRSQYFSYVGKRYKKCDRPWCFYKKQ